LRPRRGYLDKVEVSRIGEFEKKYLAYMRAEGAPILSAIEADAQLKPETEDKLKAAVSSFLATF
jgi:F0F1-type ATP synthase alpha subunit